MATDIRASVSFFIRDQPLLLKTEAKSMTYKETDKTDTPGDEHPFPDFGIGCFKERLKKTISSRSLRGFAKDCGLSEATLRSYLSGATYPTLDRLAQISAAAGVSVEWLAFGQTESRDAHSLNSEFALVPIRRSEAGADDGEAGESHVAFRQGWLRRRNLDVRHLCCVYAHGDSMEPLISNSNLLLVDQTRTGIGEGVYVIEIESQLIVKRLQRQLNGGVMIISENPSYDKQLVPKAELGDIQVVGRVVWVARDI